MAKVNLQTFTTAGRPRQVAIEQDATIGATVGRDLVLGQAVTLLSGQVLPAGYTLQASDILNGLVSSSSQIGSAGAEADWALISNIPPNVTEVAGVTGAGLATRLVSGAWAVRTLTAGTGIVVGDGDGASNPSVSLAAVVPETSGVLRAVTVDGTGRVTGYKPVIAGANVTITDNAGDVTISATGGGGGGSGSGTTYFPGGW